MGEQEGNPLLLDSSEMHKMPLEALMKQLETTHDGMPVAVTKKKRSANSDNTIPPPLSAPAWLCCLLPCLMATKSMEQYKQVVPQSSQVKRSGRPWVNMEATGILPGDIVKINNGERVPADMRIISCSAGCSFDSAAVTGKHQPHVIASTTLLAKDYLASPNMAFAGYLCVSGECTGVVVATGADTIMGKLVNQGQWPPKGF